MNDRAAPVVAGDACRDVSPRWRAHLRLEYHRRGARTIDTHEHEGPLRVLKALYPEGEGICHHVVVHPPGGIAGGDELAIDVDVGEGAHALITTPGASRFYRSRGEPAAQRVRARLHAGARLEWLPMETIVHDAARATNELHLDVAAGASMLGWDLVCLGLPASAQPFVRGVLSQCIDARGVWLERARIDAQDTRLLHSPLGLGGRSVFGVAWLLVDEAGEGAITAPLDAVRALLMDEASTEVAAAATRLAPRLLVVRVLAYRAEPAMHLLRRVRAVWRREAWGLAGVSPRVWST